MGSVGPITWAHLCGPGPDWSIFLWAGPRLVNFFLALALTGLIFLTGQIFLTNNPSFFEPPALSETSETSRILVTCCLCQQVRFLKNHHAVPPNNFASFDPWKKRWGKRENLTQFFPRSMENGLNVGKVWGKWGNLLKFQRYIYRNNLNFNFFLIFEP